jgi:hypothetical protein
MTIRRVVPDITSERIDESCDFYVGLLGFTVAMDIGWVVTFASPSNPTAQITLMRGTRSDRAAQHLFGLGERPIRHVPLAGFEGYPAGVLLPTKALGVDHLAAGLKLGFALVALENCLHLELLGRRRGFVQVDKQQIAHEASFRVP